MSYQVNPCILDQKQPLQVIFCYCLGGFLVSDSHEDWWENRRLIFLFNHSVINYINDGKEIDEAISMANKKYSVDFDETILK